MPKIKVEKELFDKMKDHVTEKGYSSIEEFVAHIIEKEVV